MGLGESPQLQREVPGPGEGPHCGYFGKEQSMQAPESYCWQEAASKPSESRGTPGSSAELCWPMGVQLRASTGRINRTP